MATKLDKLGKLIETDILILDSGAAGCGAAIGAAENGCRTVLVDKGKVESSGCLGGGNDHFMAVLNTDPETDSDKARGLRGYRISFFRHCVFEKYLISIGSPGFICLWCCQSDIKEKTTKNSKRSWRAARKRLDLAENVPAFHWLDG